MNPDVITLNNGVALPRIGYGVFRMTDAEMAQINTLDTGHSCFGSRDTAEKVHAFLDAACAYQV